MTENTLEVENTVENQEDTTSAEDVKTGKKYSNEEMQKIISDRVNREKAVSKKLKSEYDELVKGYEEKVTAYEQKLNQMVEAQLKDLPVPVKKLLEKLDALEKIEWLSDPDNKSMLIERKTIPTTPKVDKENEQKKPKSLGQLF
jgi:hypothetical protein